VEQALGAAIEYGDFSPFAELLTVLPRPYEDQAALRRLCQPARQRETLTKALLKLRGSTPHATFRCSSCGLVMRRH
jgi:hypothetical protein